MSKKLVFAEEKIEIDFKGTVYNVRFPTSLELVAYTEKSKKVNKENLLEVLEVNHDFLENLGLPREVLSKLNTKQTKQIFEALQGN